MIKRKLFCTLLLVFIFYFTSLAIQQEVQMNSIITHVQIYPDSARLIREGEVELAQGNYRIIFSDMIEIFDDKTVHVELEQETNNKARINGVSIETILLKEEPEEKIRQLQEEIKRLEKEIKKIISEKNSLNDKIEFLKSIVYLLQDKKSDNTIVQFPAVEQLESIYEFLDERLKTNYALELYYDFQVESYREKITFLQRQLQQVTEERRDTKKIISVDVEVFQNSHFNIIVSYQINKGISWQPVYDARVNLKDEKIELFTYGLIKQMTGVNWENVNVSLSTAKPTVSGELPAIQSWFLIPYSYEQKRSMPMEMPAVFREESDELMESAIGDQGLLVPVEHKGTSVTFYIPQKVSIVSGSSQEKVIISEERLKGKFNYKTYPMMNPYMYFNVFIENHLDIPLLPGSVNIFLDGGYTGSTHLGYIPPGEDFDISLGIAENVKVQRELLKKFRDETLIGTIPSSKIVTRYEYKIIIENFQQTNSSCQLFEAIPVPGDDRIQVNIERVTKEPNTREWNNRKGIWMWEFFLEPQEKVEIDIIYSIIHPRDIEIMGLP